MSRFLEENENDLDWVEELNDELDTLNGDLELLADQIRRLETEFRGTLSPQILTKLSRARQTYILTLDTIDFFVMRRRHRIEWHLNSLGD